jgi:thiol-disulfide isomerase/thioredoxin
VHQYPRRQYEAARKAGQKANYREYLDQAKQLAKQYAARFKVAEVKEDELVALAKLYLQAGEPTLAREAINRRLKSSNLGENERAETLVAAVEVVMAGTPTDESIKLGEEYTDRLDALSDAMLKQKLKAHSRMAGYYSYADIDDKNLEHHNKILALIEQLPSAEKKSFTDQKAGAYDAIALVYANRGQTAQALELLNQAKAAVSDTPESQRWLDQSIARYSQIGKPGAPLKGAYWINADASTKQVDPRGHVTLIQFTAHWCIPCRKSYPAMLKFHEQYAQRGLQVVMATELYGYFDRREDLKPEEEVAADRDYYIEHHKLPFKIAVESKMRTSEGKPAAEQSESNSMKYIVGGIPQIVLLDKQGVVRQILIGWDPANEARMTKLIEELLKEPAAKP